MIEIDQEKLELIRNYVDLLGTVVEGFDYVVVQYTNGDMRAGDKMLSDIFLAFTQFESANQTLLNVFVDDKIVSEEVENFYELIEIIGELEIKFDKDGAKKSIILERLYPAFTAWKEQIELSFLPYIQH